MFITCNCLNNNKDILQAMLYCIMYWKTKPSLQTTTNQMHRCVLISSFSTERKLKCLYINNNWSKAIDLKILVSNFYNKKFKQNHTITLCLSLWAAHVIQPSCYYSILKSKQDFYQCCHGWPKHQQKLP